MKNSIKILGIVLVLLIAGTNFLSAQNWMGRGMYRYRMPGLTEKQRSDIDTLAKAHWNQMDALSEEMLESTDIDERGEIAKKLQILRDTHRNNVLDLLTDEQKEAYGADEYLPFGWGGRGLMYGNFRGRGLRGGNGFGNMNRMYQGRGLGRGIGFGNRNYRRF